MHDHQQPGKEELGRPRCREHQVADRHEHTARDDGTLRSDQPVGDPAARQRRHEHGRRVEAVDRGGRLVVHSVAAVRHRVDEEEHQQGPHPVEGEAFPHLGEEKGRERAGVTEEGPGAVEQWHAVVAVSFVGADYTARNRLLPRIRRLLLGL